MIWFKKQEKTDPPISNRQFGEITDDIINFNKRLEALDARVSNIEDQLKRFKSRYYREKEVEEETEPIKEDLSSFKPKYI